MTSWTRFQASSPVVRIESSDVGEPVWRDEVFGPVVAVMAFDDEEGAGEVEELSD